MKVAPDGPMVVGDERGPFYFIAALVGLVAGVASGSAIIVALMRARLDFLSKLWLGSAYPSLVAAAGAMGATAAMLALREWCHRGSRGRRRRSAL